MPDKIINEHTDQNIKEYLAAENKVANSEDKRWTEKLENKTEKGFNLKKNRKIIAAVFLLVLIFLSAAAYLMFKKGQESFDNEKVKINIEVPDEITSGEEISIALKYGNETNIALKNVKANISAPPNFIFVSSDKEVKKEANYFSWNIGSLAAGESGKIRIFGKIIGEKGDIFDLLSSISYKPSNFNSEFKSESAAKLKIASVPFELSIKAPSALMNGEEADYLIEYKNASDNKFEAVIKAHLPKEFRYNSSLPKADEEKENYLAWKINSLASGAEGKITINGGITGNKDEEKEIKIALEASKNDREEKIEYLTRKALIKIQEVPIAINQTINGSENYSAYKGEELEYKIKFKNISGKEIKGLVINSELEGNADLESLAVANGSYDDKYKMTWSALNVPELAALGAGGEGEASFKVKVKEYIEIKDQNGKNFIIKNKATVNIFNFDSDSSKIGKTIASSESAVKISTSLFIRSRGYFNDDGRIKNSGVIPPEAGKETNYTIHWNLSSLFNDLENVIVAATLPEKVKWTGNYISSDGKISLGDETNGAFTPKEEEEKNKNENNVQKTTEEDAKTNLTNGNNSLAENDNDKGKVENSEQGTIKIEEEKLYYNTKTREVRWEMSKLDANTGVMSPAKEIVFQISIAPTDLEVGDVMKILDEVKAEGYDKFTEKEITALDSKLTTELPDDESIGVEEGIVIESSELN